MGESRVDPKTPGKEAGDSLFEERGHLFLPCNCNSHIATFEICQFGDDSWVGGPYISFGVRTEGDTTIFSLSGLLNRLRVCWSILRGRRHRFNDIILSKESGLLLRDWLSLSYLGQEAGVFPVLMDILSGRGEYASLLPSERIDLARDHVGFLPLYTSERGMAELRQRVKGDTSR